MGIIIGCGNRSNAGIDIVTLLFEASLTHQLEMLTIVKLSALGPASKTSKSYLSRLT
jgi:hypothetical protein